MNNDFKNNGFDNNYSSPQQPINNFNNIPENNLEQPINLISEQSNEIYPQPIQTNIEQSQQVASEPVIQQPVSFQPVQQTPVAPTTPTPQVAPVSFDSNNQSYIQNPVNQIPNNNNYDNKPKKNKVLLIVIIAVIIGIAVFLGIKFLGGKNTVSDQASTISEGDPILIEKGDKYGYIDTNGNVIIPFKYDDAWSFIGGYTRVSEITDVDGYLDELFYLIDTKGNIIYTANSSRGILYYDRYDVWIINGKLYNGSLKQLSADSITVDYKDNGYLSWESEKSAGIMDYTGKITYTYNFSGDEDFLSINVPDVSATLKEKYCIVNVENKKYAIVNCETGKVVYNFTDYYISEYDNNIFELSLKSNFEFVSSIYIQNDQIIYETNDQNIDLYYDSSGYVKIDDSNKPYSERYSYINILTGEITQEKPSVDIPTITSIDIWEEYTNYKQQSCDNGGYSLVKDDTVVVPCGYDSFKYFDLNLYKYLVSKGKDYVLAKKDRKTYLVDLKTGQVVEEFNMPSVITREDSSFVYYQDDNGTYIYNLISGKSFTTSDVDAKVYIRSNYFVIKQDSKSDYYNMDCKLIYVDSE